MRNYQEYPLSYSEKPKKEDLEFLYIHENKTKKELIKYFNRNKDTISQWFKYYNIIKPKELIKQTIERVQIEKYGTRYYMQSRQYQLKKDQIHKKRVSTNLKRYGTKTPAENDKIKQKAKETCLQNIDKKGLNSYQRTKEKSIKTCLEKYGCCSYSQTEECKNKTRQTLEKKYGAKSFGETDKFKNLYKNKKWVKGITDKIYLTRKNNKSFNISKEEKFVSEQLLKKFGEIKRQYKSKEYPYACDFYVPSKKLYIECNFHWTHGKHSKKVFGAFDKNNKEHIELLNKWKTKNSKYYDNAIKTWTEKDIRKIETFKQNKLNYKIFYTLEEFNNWYNTV